MDTEKAYIFTGHSVAFKRKLGHYLRVQIKMEGCWLDCKERRKELGASKKKKKWRSNKKFLSAVIPFQR